MERSSVPKATLGRLPCYLQYLKELDNSGVEFVSATAIAKGLALGEVQVRKDLNATSGEGKPKIGYETGALIKSIEKTLGCNNMKSAVIVGAGKLGRALLNYDGFKDFGIEIIAAFDVCESLRKKSDKIFSMNDFKSFCEEKKVKIGIITVNESSAQEVCDKMVDAKIQAIWNFTPKKLCVPETVLVKQENLALSLAHLNNQIK